MKKILLIFVVLGLTACNTYTVQNKLSTDVEINGKIIVPSNGCIELADFFNLVGDFPATFTNLIKDSEGKIVSRQNIDSEEYKAANYIISRGESLISIKEVPLSLSCEVGKVDKVDRNDTF